MKVIFHFQISWLVTLQFNEVLKENEEKTFTWKWRKRKEKEILNGNGGQMKRQVEVIQELKTVRLLTNQIQKVVQIKDASLLNYVPYVL